MLAVRSSEFTLTLMCIMLFLSHADAPTFLLRHNCTLPWNLQLNLPYIYIYTYNIFFFYIFLYHIITDCPMWVPRTVCFNLFPLCGIGTVLPEIWVSGAVLVLYPFSKYTCLVSEQLLPAAAKGLRVPKRAAAVQRSTSSRRLGKDTLVSILTAGLGGGEKKQTPVKDKARLWLQQLINEWMSGRFGCTQKCKE